MNKEQYFLISTKEAFDKWNIEFHEFTEQFKADLYFVKAEHPIVALLKFLERISKSIFISENDTFLNEIFKDVRVTNKEKYAKECVKNSVIEYISGKNIQEYYSVKHSGICNIIEILFSYNLDYNSLEKWYNNYLEFPFGNNKYGPIQIYSIDAFNYTNDIVFEDFLEKFLIKNNIESAIWINDWMHRLTAKKLIRVDIENY